MSIKVFQTFALLSSGLICAPRKGTNTEPYKFMLDILTNNSSAENRTDLTLGRLLIYQYSTNTTSSWLKTFNGFEFSFR